MVRITLIGLFGILLLLNSSCVKDKTMRDSSIIHLKWNKTYSDDALDKSITGLAWAFSHIGANEVKRLYEMPIQDNTVAVDVRKLGFTNSTLEKLVYLNELLINSEEYNIGYIDMGRYVSLIIGSSAHYYALTEIPETYTELINQYDLNPSLGYIDNSAISTEDRILRYTGQEGMSQLFVTEEVDSETGVILEYETADLMPNGQLRFAVFNADGFRENSANPSNSEAGKPAKCMWCHESGIQPLFTEQEDFDGYLTYLQLTDTLSFYKAKLASKQELITTGVDYSEAQDHNLMELLYIGFMEPSAERLSQEWGMSVSNVLARLEGLTTHVNEEFSFLGELYDRKMVDPLAPYKSLPVSADVREFTGEEVSYLN